MTTEEFIKKAKKVHGDRYGYDKVVYIKSNIKVVIQCKDHGEFTQTPNKHLLNNGCHKCGILSIKNKVSGNNKDFIDKSKLIHGDKYDYSLVKYNRSGIKVKIICKYHGVFEQRPNDHLSGKGCIGCRINNASIQQGKNPTGWNINNWEKAAKKSKNFDSFKVYVIRCYDSTEQFYKIGRTYRDIKKRFYCNEVMPYRYEVLKELIFDNALD